MKLIDIPQKVEKSAYEDAIASMTNHLSEISGIHSVFQIGSVSHLGISDIDMLVVFNDDAEYKQNVRNSFNANSYLFTHALYGCSISHWEQLQDYTFFHNYKILQGKSFSKVSSSLDEIETSQLKRQIALEFLVKNYYTMKIQEKYKTIKARSFLLEGKALIYDLEFLGINDGPLWTLINQIIELRSNWFENRQRETILKELFIQLPELIKALLIDEFAVGDFYLMTDGPVSVSRNVRIINGDNLAIKSTGLVPFNLGLLKERKRFNALHRINKFDLTLPYNLPNDGGVIKKRFDFLSEVKKYNSKCIHDFLIPASSLKIN